MTAFIDIHVDGNKLDNATAETLEAALEAAKELAADTNSEPEDIALTLLLNSILSLPDGEAFIRSTMGLGPSATLPVLRGVN